MLIQQMDVDTLLGDQLWGHDDSSVSKIGRTFIDPCALSCDRSTHDTPFECRWHDSSTLILNFFPFVQVEVPFHYNRCSFHTQ